MGVRKSLVLFPVKPGSADTAKKGEAVRLIAQNREFGTWDSDGCLVGIYDSLRGTWEFSPFRTLLSNIYNYLSL